MHAEYGEYEHIDSNPESVVSPVVETLPHCWIEEKIQIDRKRLENMITGNGKFSGCDLSASDFFSHVEMITNAKISWPSKLKIGAKTKKDPFVKIIGLPCDVAKAKESILAVLRVKKDRITLKMEIDHSSHSHIIGRGGRNTQDVMRDTNCHIHFPDSNKHNDVDKNNQVSIAGGVAQVERARSKLRLISPISLNVTVDVNSKVPCNITDFQRILASPEITVQVLMPSSSTIQLIIKGSLQFEELMLNTVDHFYCNLIERGFSTESAICRCSFELRPALLQPNGLFSLNTIRWIAFHTKTQMQFSPQGSSILILGGAPSIFTARRYLTGLLPITIQFEKTAESSTNKQSLRNIEAKFDVLISDKKKANGGGGEMLTVIRSYEANIKNVFAARQQILQTDISEAIQVYDYIFMHNFLSTIKELSTTKPSVSSQYGSASLLDISSRSPCRSPSFFSEHQSSPNFLTGKAHFDSFCNDPNSSIYMGTNDHDRQVLARSPRLPDNHMLRQNSCNERSNRDGFNEFWKAPGSERQMAMNRDKMLLMANKATYVQEMTNVRQPTDLWSGYGFSNSLPADILKLGLKQIWDQPDSEYGFGATTSINRENKTNSRTQVDSAPQILGLSSKALASVREEEEFSDYNNSINSNVSSSSQTIKDFNIPSVLKRQAFTASASVFESAPLQHTDVNWDIRIFVDPAMVLAQLGCGEYLTQFRDQEIDMQAFLLLDEQNLKDIGVSTMGARKKIFNAILKLRESARKQGCPV